ncbi:MAG: 50S ribosomal protein L29 [Alphaproteobacteria bacterium]
MLLDMNQLCKMDVKSLKEKVLALKKELFALRFQRVAGQLKNTSELRRVKRSIAQVKTALVLQKS